MNDFVMAKEVMQELFSRDYQFALATSSNNVPSLRYIDTYFDGEYFYIVTHALSQKAKEIAENPDVALCARKMHAFSGKAVQIGHPLLPENAEIRQKLTKAFAPWYFAHNNENDENMCYIKITPTTGFFHKDRTAYKVNFVQETVATFPFSFDTVLTED